MLGSRLASLDVPVDGSAELVSVEVTVDAQSGCRRWTVIFQEAKASSMPTASAAPHAAMASPRPSGPAVTFAPLPTSDRRLPYEDVSPFQPPPIAVTDPMHMLQMDRIFALKCPVKTYAWGKLGSDSLVGRLASEGLDELEINDGTPYAELWMGTHPSGPAMVMLTSPWRTVTPLSEWIKLNPTLLGPRKMHLDSPKLQRRRSMLRMRAHSLPFLFKILSVRTALSIQAHPDKVLAAELHVRHPEHYKDDNHKPEMAVAITPFEALCSFQPVYSMLNNLRATPELVSLVGERVVAELDDAAAGRARCLAPSPGARSDSRGDAAKSDAARGDSSARSDRSDGAHVEAAFARAAAELAGAPKLDEGGGGVDDCEHKPPALLAAEGALKAKLRALFSSLMEAPAEAVKTALDALVRRVQCTSAMLRAPVDDLALRLHEQYPGDVGVFCVYLLNYKRLAPGEALFLGANEPHAYVNGDCAEIMATSDNVVRAGLTPKWKDVETLCACLTYADGPPHLVTPTQRADEPHVWTYAPPDVVDEFLLDRVEYTAEDAKGAAKAAAGGVPLHATLSAASGLAILIVVHGAATVEQLDDHTADAVGVHTSLTSGATHLVCPHTTLRIRPAAFPLLMFRAAAKPIEDLDTP